MLALLQSFRVIALLEGASYLLLLCIAMPLKYWAGVPIAVRIAGSVHGALFLAYLVCTGMLFFRGQWSVGRASVAMGASVVPVATFVFDREIRRELAELGRSP